MEELERDGADMRRMKNATGKLEYSRMDQDVLNATIMATDTPICLLGSEAMGMFPFVNTIMPHAMCAKSRGAGITFLMHYEASHPRERIGRTGNLQTVRFIRSTNLSYFANAPSLGPGHLISLMHTRSSRDF